MTQVKGTATVTRGIIALVAMMSSVAVAVPANATHVASTTGRQETETVCTGGTLLSNTSASNGSLRYPGSAGVIVSCTLGGDPALLYTLHGFSQNTSTAMAADVNAAGTTARWNTPAVGTTEWQKHTYTHPVKVAGGSKLTYTGVTATLRADFFTLEDGSPPPDTTPPSNPTNLTTGVSGNDVVFSWTASTDNVGVTGYDVRKDGGTAVAVTGSPFTDTGAAGASHNYEVRAKDAAGNLSAWVAVSYTYVPPADTTSPSDPTNLSTVVSGGDVVFSWTASTDNVGVTGYDVRKDNGVPVAVTASPFTDAGAANASHTYEVRARDAAGNRSAWVITSYTYVAPPTPDTEAPLPPGSFTGTTYGDDIFLTWTEPSDNVGVTGYRLTIDGGTPFDLTSTSYRHVGGRLANHTYTVSAFDAAGNVSLASTYSYTYDPNAPVNSGPYPGGYNSSDTFGNWTDDYSKWLPAVSFAAALSIITATFFIAFAGKVLQSV